MKPINTLPAILTEVGAQRLNVEPGPVQIELMEDDGEPPYARHVWREEMYLGGFVTVGPEGVLPDETTQRRSL